MMQVNIDNTMEIQTPGMKALRDALGVVGAARFMQQYNLGYGDYTKERLEEPEISHDELMAMLKELRSE